MIADAAKFPLLCQPIGAIRTDTFIHSMAAQSCVPFDTLEAVVEKMVHAHVHCLFVVDPERRPIGVISMRDVIARFVKEPADSKLGEFFYA